MYNKLHENEIDIFRHGYIIIYHQDIGVYATLYWYICKYIYQHFIYIHVSLWPSTYTINVHKNKCIIDI